VVHLAAFPGGRAEFYDTLLEPDADGLLVPALAERYSISDDSLRWTFELREGVKFHHGKDFEAEDVVASFKRILR